MSKKTIILIIAIIVILVAVFLSQQAYSQDAIKNILSYINKYGGASLMGALGSKPANAVNTNSASNSTDGSTSGSPANSSSYKLPESTYNSSGAKAAPSITSVVADKVKMAVSGISENVTGGLKNGGEAIANSANTVKENISDAGKNIENYFSGIKDAVTGKENNPNTCQCPTGQ